MTVTSLVFAEELPVTPLMRFYAINAGYKDDNSSQNYDFIELERLSESELSLAPYRIVYTNSSGNIGGEISFADNLVLATNRLVLGASVSPQFIAAEGSVYLYNFSSSGLASTAGKLELYQGENKVDEICWGKLECADNYAKFATKIEDNYSLVRCAEESCSDSHFYEPAKYYPSINLNSILEVVSERDEEVLALDENDCEGVIISELYSNYADNASEQFIELYNPTPERISLKNCSVSYKNDIFPLSGEVEPGSYYVFKDQNLSLTKDPSSSNTVSVINGKRDIKTQINYPHGQKKGASYALFDISSVNPFWRQTYHVTPGEANVYQEFQTCPNGKTINPKTGNCVKEEVTKTETVTCPEGKYLNPLTNRCKAIEASTSLTPCREGYERNPETNRCRKITSASTESTPCKEGYERNPETNRCRKIRENTGETADYAPEPVEEQEYYNPKIFIATTAIVVAVVAGLSYVVYQYRQEIRKAIRNLRLKLRKV